jgi:hypothetical protein
VYWSGLTHVVRKGVQLRGFVMTAVELRVSRPEDILVA